MPAATQFPEAHLAAQHDADRVLSALHTDRVADHLLAGRPAPGPRQTAVTLRALSDFPLCIRILPLSDRRHRGGDRVTGVSHYLARFADHLAHRDVRKTYEPEYWILGEPVTERLLRIVAKSDPAPEDRPTSRQVAAVLLALADTEALELPRRLVEVAGDGDLPWNGATGIGRFLRSLADRVAAR